MCAAARDCRLTSVQEPFKKGPRSEVAIRSPRVAKIARRKYAIGFNDLEAVTRRQFVVQVMAKMDYSEHDGCPLDGQKAAQTMAQKA